MEARALPRLTTTEGLWRKSTKARPGSITEYIRFRKLLGEEEIQFLHQTTHSEIVAFQQGFAEALRKGTTAEFLNSHAEHDYRVQLPTAA